MTKKKIVTLRHSFKTEHEARLAEPKCLADHKKKNFRNRNTTTTFEQVYETWKEHSRNTMKESIYVSQINKGDRLIIPHFRDKPINKISLSMC